jgi:hypothetical protein
MTEYEKLKDEFLRLTVETQKLIDTNPEGFQSQKVWKEYIIKQRQMIEAGRKCVNFPHQLR